MDDVEINAEDAAKIAQEVEQYRLTLLRIYRLAHAQGQIDMANKTLARMKAAA